ncbi:MAG: DUF6206 family protein [archaeon]
MRKYTRDGERRYIKIGAGGFVSPKLILHTKESARRKSPLAGKVLKQYRSLVSAKDAVRLRNTIGLYDTRLNEMGIKTLATRIVFAPTRKQNAYQLNLIQEHVQKEMILDNYLKSCTPKEAGEIFSKSLDLLERMHRYNKSHKEKIGADITAKNLALVNGELVLLDIYPPFMKGEGELKVTDVADQRVRLESRILRLLSPARSDMRAKRKLEKMVNTNNALEVILKTFSKARPKMRREFFELAWKRNWD